MTVLELDQATIADALDLFRYGARGVRTYARGEIDYSESARELYSYGRHFPLCRYVPRKLRGRRDGRAQRDLFVLNGDEWRGRGGWHPSRTPDHQRMVRERVALYDADVIVLPFSAVTGAGIELDTVRAVHVRADANWTETRTARTLAELPRHERHESYSVELTAPTLELVPDRYRRVYRERTDNERAELERERGRELYGYERADTLPLLPDADGLYHWSETRKRERARDADGLYSWSVRLHRLGDALFTAVRPETVTRRARPFESETENARGSVELGTGPDARGRHCESADDRRHESGPAGACIHCGAELYARDTWRRRALYLSSFDTNESPPLYFLAEVPPSSRADTVESALDALAPRAVHAAMARGRHVARQGDIFFIDTALTDADLIERGARFGRLTQFTLSARARAGEIGALPKLTAAQRRRQAARERGYARRAWRDTMREELTRDTWHERAELARAARRAANGARWFELSQRQRRERAELAELLGAGMRAPIVAPCAECGAGFGASCADDCRARRYRRELGGRRADGDALLELAELHRNERATLRRETDRTRDEYARPKTSGSGRRQAARARELALDKLERARAELRRSVFAAGPIERGRYVTNPYRARAESAKRARAEFESCAARARACQLVPVLGERDAYRARGSGRAGHVWRSALELAQRKYRPETVFDTERWRAYRELTRRHLSIYGTAHSASRVARVGSAVYVSGTVRHVIELEPNRFGGPDHAPLTLTDGRWYLAVRNAVPRQARRRRRPRASSARVEL